MKGVYPDEEIAHSGRLALVRAEGAAGARRRGRAPSAVAGARKRGDRLRRPMPRIFASPTRRAGSARPPPASTSPPRWAGRPARAAGRPRPAGQRHHGQRHRQAHAEEASTRCCSAWLAGRARVTSSATGYDVLPANRDLAGAEVELVDLDNRENAPEKHALASAQTITTSSSSTARPASAC
jgi:hypothetical protein